MKTGKKGMRSSLFTPFSYVFVLVLMCFSKIACYSISKISKVSWFISKGERTAQKLCNIVRCNSLKCLLTAGAWFVQQAVGKSRQKGYKGKQGADVFEINGYRTTVAVPVLLNDSVGLNNFDRHANSIFLRTL